MQEGNLTTLLSNNLITGSQLVSVLTGLCTYFINRRVEKRENTRATIVNNYQFLS